jgi:hypothetical protein
VKESHQLLKNIVSYVVSNVATNLQKAHQQLLKSAKYNFPFNDQDEHATFLEYFPIFQQIHNLLKAQNL